MRPYRVGLALAGIMLFGMVPPLSAEEIATSSDSGVRLSDGAPLSLKSMQTGEQLLLQPLTGTVAFAGHTVELANARMVVGYASEVAYLVMLEGEARIGDIRAKAGRMLLIPPFGGEVAVERFDARRLKDAMPFGADAQAAEALDRIARSQRLGMAIGRLQRTSFNVAASGEASQEQGRRAVVGGEVVRAIRFGGETDAAKTAQRVVASASEALAKGDAYALAQLLDPVPFGVDDAEARIALAQAMIVERDWSRQLASVKVQAGADQASWMLNGPGGATRIQLRASNGFPYVATIDVEDVQ